MQVLFDLNELEAAVAHIAKHNPHGFSEKYAKATILRLGQKVAREKQLCMGTIGALVICADRYERDGEEIVSVDIYVNPYFGEGRALSTLSLEVPE